MVDNIFSHQFSLSIHLLSNSVANALVQRAKSGAVFAQKCRRHAQKAAQFLRSAGTAFYVLLRACSSTHGLSSVLPPSNREYRWYFCPSFPLAQKSLPRLHIAMFVHHDILLLHITPAVTRPKHSMTFRVIMPKAYAKRRVEFGVCVDRIVTQGPAIYD